MAHPILNSREKINYNLLNDLLKVSKEEKVVFDRFLTAYEGDFWQKGKEVLLPPPDPRDAGRLTPFFQDRFVSRNMILEAVERVSSAFLGRSPNWQYVIGGQRLNLRLLKQKQTEKRKRETVEGQLNEVGLAPPRPKPANPPAPEPGQPEPPPTPPVPDTEVSEDELKLAQRVEEVERLLGEYWTREGLADKMSEAFERRLVGGRGGIRVYIPAKYKNRVKKQEGGENTEEGAGEDLISFETLDEALDAIRVEFVDPRKSRLLDDEGDLFSMVFYERKDDYTSNQTTKVIEFSFVDDDDKTFIGRVTDKEDSKKKPSRTKKAATKDPLSDLELSDALELDGRTTFFEISGKPYVSEQMFRINQAVNLALTCGGFNLVDNGFGEMITTNVDLEMEKVADPTSSTGYRDVPRKIRRGGGAHNNFIGVREMDLNTGKEVISDPGVFFREPSSMQAFDDGYMLYYRAFLAECGQLFALISGDATASGEARIQAMADFYLKIKKFKAQVDKMGSWLLTTVLRFAAIMSGKESEFNDVSMLFDSRMRIGNLTANERDMVMKMQEKGLISKETARVLLDVEDPALEEDLIDKEREKEVVLNPERVVQAQENKVMLEDERGGE